MSRKNLSVISLVLLMFVITILGGCGNGEEPVPEEPGNTGKEYDVTLYFANDEYVETGNEELDQLIEVEDMSLTAKEGDQYMELLDVALRTVPENIDSATTLIDDTIQFNSVDIEGSLAIVDIKGGNLSGGSMTEAYVISQIVESLTESFDEIEEVQFLIDGAEAESLMGHYDLTEPYSEGIYN